MEYFLSLADGIVWKFLLRGEVPELASAVRHLTAQFRARVLMHKEPPTEHLLQPVEVSWLLGPLERRDHLSQPWPFIVDKKAVSHLDFSTDSLDSERESHRWP